jgi:hypothetical protein
MCSGTRCPERQRDGAGDVQFQPCIWNTDALRVKQSVHRDSRRAAGGAMAAYEQSANDESALRQSVQIVSETLVAACNPSDEGLLRHTVADERIKLALVDP